MQYGQIMEILLLFSLQDKVNNNKSALKITKINNWKNGTPSSKIECVWYNRYDDQMRAYIPEKLCFKEFKQNVFIALIQVQMRRWNEWNQDL